MSIDPTQTRIDADIHQRVLYDDLPFPDEMPRFNQSTVNAMEEARRISRDPSVKGYANMEDLWKALLED